jgi:DNA topoisomerase-2
MTNQARFIQMIIDGKLIVSKKKKTVLVEELKKLAFTPFPKVTDAKKAGEQEDAQEDAEESDDVVGAGDYDYLLGVSTPASLLNRSHLTNCRWLSGR